MEVKYITNRDDIALLQTMLGIDVQRDSQAASRAAADDSGIPLEVHRVYREYRSYYDRCCPGGALSIDTLALICQRADAVAKRNRHEWLYAGWKLGTIGPGMPVEVRRHGKWVPATLQDWNEESRKVRVDLGVDHGEERVVDFNVDDVRPIASPAIAPPTYINPGPVSAPKAKK